MKKSWCDWRDDWIVTLERFTEKDLAEFLEGGVSAKVGELRIEKIDTKCVSLVHVLPAHMPNIFLLRLEKHADRILREIRVPGLTILYVDDCEISVENLLACVTDCKVWHLVLNSCKIIAAGADDFSNFGRALPNLKMLDLFGCKFVGGDCVDLLASVLRHCPVEHMDLRVSELEDCSSQWEGMLMSCKTIKSVKYGGYPWEHRTWKRKCYE